MKHLSIIVLFLFTPALLTGQTENKNHFEIKISDQSQSAEPLLNATLIPITDLTLAQTTRPLPKGEDLDKQFPEAPEPIKATSYGGYAHDKSGETKLSPVLTKKFIAAHAVFLAANVFDIEMTHQGLAHHRCVEGGLGGEDPHPSRGELYANDMLIFAAFTGIDYMLGVARFPKWMPLQFSAAAVGTSKHLSGGIHWATQCW